MYDHLMLNASGRIIYAGAGTSARVGLQDGVELLPTFNWPKKRVDFIIAGGNEAILNAVENAEDDMMEATKDTSKKQKTEPMTDTTSNWGQQCLSLAGVWALPQETQTRKAKKK